LFVEKMMISPNCPEHGRLVRDLALGRLENDAALDAEVVRSTCGVCRRWWQEQFEGSTAEVVDDAVAAAFTELQLPSRRRSHGWWAIAAVAVMTAGVATLWLGRAPTPADRATVDRVALIASLDFEVPGEVVEAASVSVAIPEIGDHESTTVVAALPVERPIVVDVSVAESAAPDAPVVRTETESTPIFVGSFESGDLGAWVPST
jgi:hypothetical protein